jgi:hypothetical protein
VKEDDIDEFYLVATRKAEELELESARLGVRLVPLQLDAKRVKDDVINFKNLLVNKKKELMKALYAVDAQSKASITVPESVRFVSLHFHVVCSV